MKRIGKVSVEALKLISSGWVLLEAGSGGRPDQWKSPSGGLVCSRQDALRRMYRERALAKAKRAYMASPRRRTREDHAALMRAHSTTLKRRATYLRNVTPERRSDIARNAWAHRKPKA